MHPWPAGQCCIHGLDAAAPLTLIVQMIALPVGLLLPHIAGWTGARCYHGCVE